jgi:cytochrome c oxidase cbb3-type subunit 3
MSSRCLRTAALLAGAALVLVACEREQRELRPRPSAAKIDQAITLSALQPGEPLAASDARGRHFEGNAWHVNQGQALFKAFNCNGCHGNGGGAIGPALMDAQWRYGGTIEQIHASIVQGRPNGMPAFAGKIPDDEAWQIAAYVRTLSANAPMYVAGGGRQGMAVAPPPARLSELEPKTSESAGDAESDESADDAPPPEREP